MSTKRVFLICLIIPPTPRILLYILQTYKAGPRVSCSPLRINEFKGDHSGLSPLTINVHYMIMPMLNFVISCNKYVQSFFFFFHCPLKYYRELPIFYLGSNSAKLIILSSTFIRHQMFLYFCVCAFHLLFVRNNIFYCKKLNNFWIDITEF